MENEEIVSAKPAKKASFLKENLAFILTMAFGALAILILFAPVLNYRVKIDGQSIYTSLNMADLLSDKPFPAWPMAVILAGNVLGMIFAVLAKFVAKFKDKFAVASVFSFVVALSFIFIQKEFANYAATETEAYYIESYKEASILWGSSVSILASSLAAIFSLSDTMYYRSFDTRAIAEDGVLIAAAFVLNFIKIPLGATGGSANFQMLPLMIIALRRGPLHGLVAGGLIYGLLTCISDGYGFATFPFDYFIGFGSVAVMGFFSKQIFPSDKTSYNVKGMLFLAIASVIATLLRLVGGTVSSMVVYGYTFVPALEYNYLYVGISGLLALVVLLALYQPLAVVNKRFPIK